MTRTVALFATCLADQMWPEVAHATVAVLERAGCRVTFDPAQTCCAQPAFNSGHWPEAREVARHFVRTFERADAIVAPSGSCTAMVHRYPDLFRDETFECRPARSECDLAEICDGREPRCPPDKIAPDDSACDTDACGTERCRDGECIGGFLCRVGEYCACGEFCLPEGSPCI